MEHKTYNGWTNYETWAVNLWLDGDEYLNEMAQNAYNEAEADQYFTKEERATLDLADSLKDYLEELQEETCPVTGLFADLLNAAMSEIDYHDLAESYMSEVEKDEPEEETEE